jgi:integrase
VAKGWLKRTSRGKLLYCWYNSQGAERNRTIGDASMTDEEGWLKVGQLGLDKMVAKADPATCTFGEVMAAYLAYGKTRTGKDKAHSTKSTEEANARNYLSYWSDRVACEIEPAEVQEWLDAQSEGMRARLRNLMSGIYRYGQKYGKIPRTSESNPMRWVSASEQTGYEAITLEPEEAFLVLDQIQDPLVRCLVVLVAVTAMRCGEALGLKWGDIDWKKGKINIRRDWVYGKLGNPKSMLSKAPVEMHETLAAVLQAWRDMTPYAKDDDFLFPSFKLRGKQPRRGSMIVADYVKPAAIKAGVIARDCPRFGLHNMRHGLSTFLIENGTDPVVVQRMLRHSNLPMTMHYTHNRKQARAAQGQFLDRFLPKNGRAGTGS